MFLCDASNTGLGCVLTQHQGDLEKVIMFASCSVTIVLVYPMRTTMAISIACFLETEVFLTYCVP